MPEESGQEKTEQATARKRRKAREEGQVARSMELNTALVLLAAFYTLNLFGKHMYSGICEIFRYFFSGFSQAFDLGLLQNWLFYVFIKIGLILAPLLGAVMLAGIAVNVAQVGFFLTPKNLEPKLDKLNPLSGLKRIFSKRGMIELPKNLLKVIVIGTVAFITIKKYFPNILMLTDVTPSGLFVFICMLTYKMAMKAIIALLILAILDYGYQKWQHEEDLKMTKQEVKEEYKQMEGDPHVKSKIRSKQREMAQQRMMEEVPKADVVITNPTHFAVAIKYEEKDPAPIVLAKGAGVIAQRIKAIALENNIPIHENKELARALYAAVEVGQTIPEKFFTAVAEILSYIYRQKRR